MIVRCWIPSPGPPSVSVYLGHRRIGFGKGRRRRYAYQWGASCRLFGHVGAILLGAGRRV